MSARQSAAAGGRSRTELTRRERRLGRSRRVSQQAALSCLQNIEAPVGALVLKASSRARRTRLRTDGSI